jgi:hypothetical protein
VIAVRGDVTESCAVWRSVSAGQVAFRLDDLTSLYVDVEVSEVDITVSIDNPPH